MSFRRIEGRVGLCSCILAVVALALSGPLVRGADLVIDSFDTEDATFSWSATWGSAPVLTWDSLDGSESGSSGSLLVAADYFTPADNGWEQMVITRTFETPVTGSRYASVSVDVKVNPASIPAASGNYGYFEFKRTDGSALGGVNLTNTGWTTITFKLAPTEGDLTGIVVQNGSSEFRGPVIYHLDNFRFTEKGGAEPPPTLAVTRSHAAGLRLVASAPGQAYQRQNVAYLPAEQFDGGLWWVNQGEPMTYSVTWAEFPDTSNAGFQGHIFLSADSSLGGIPDWTDPNVIFVEFQYVNTAGSDGALGTADDVVRARARFLHKVNEPSGNAMLYREPESAGPDLPAGVLGSVLAPSMLGTWSITFRNNTQIVLAAPDGSTADIILPAEEAASFEPAFQGLSALFGVQPNSDTRIDQAAVISRIRITKGAAVVVDENFQTSLDPEVWATRANDPGGVFGVPASVSMLVSWNLPDAGFVLQSAPGVTGPWSGGIEPRLVGARRVALIEGTEGPGSPAGFFRLRK